MAIAIRPIKTEVDYETALKRIDALMDAAEGTPEADELEVWATLTELYEEQHFPIDLPDPLAAIRFRMEQANLSVTDLIPMLGSEAQIEAILSGQQPLTLEIIRVLHQSLGIPAEILLKQPVASAS